MRLLRSYWRYTGLHCNRRRQIRIMFNDSFQGAATYRKIFIFAHRCIPDDYRRRVQATEVTHLSRKHSSITPSKISLFPYRLAIRITRILHTATPSTIETEL
jgi:hypothetical protein